MSATAPRKLSLKGRALMLLAQREQSREELRRKLLMYAKAQQTERSVQPDSQAEGEPGDAAADAAHRVEQLLVWLQDHGYLSEERFVESRVHARSTRYGNLRIQREFAQHGVEPGADTLRQLRESELARAQEVWRRKFGNPAADASERVRQMRFLAQRGFSAEVVRRVVRFPEDD